MYNNKENLSTYVNMNIPIPGVDVNNTGFMLNERIFYTGKTTIAIISTANSNLNGSGTIATLITGASNGTFVKKITIKAQGATTAGMVRLFFKAGLTTWLYKEILIPATSDVATLQTFTYVSKEPFLLKSGYHLCASTEKAETFIVTAEGLDMTYPA